MAESSKSGACRLALLTFASSSKRSTLPCRVSCNAANFCYCALRQRLTSGSVLYFVDEVDDAPGSPEHFKLDEPGYAYTKWVIHNKKEMILTAEEDQSWSPIRN